MSEIERRAYKRPLIALCLSLAPFIILFVISLLPFSDPPAILWLIIFLSPVYGLAMGIGSLKSGRKKIGLFGVICAGIAVAVPLIFIVFFLVFFIGAATGVISLM